MEYRVIINGWLVDQGIQFTDTPHLGDSHSRGNTIDMLISDEAGHLRRLEDYPEPVMGISNTPIPELRVPTNETELFRILDQIAQENEEI